MDFTNDITSQERQPEIRQNLIERFIRYAKICSTSNSSIATLPQDNSNFKFPSTDEQWKFAQFLKAELDDLQIKNFLDENCYLVAELPATKGYENAASMLFSAHLDTSDEAPGLNVNPILKTDAKGRTIITGDGTTLLGADDKAGIAIILEAAKFLASSKIPHGKILLMFSPDEETGHGMDRVPFDKIKTDVAFTFDGGACPEIESECFNAYACNITFTGITIHSGYAKGIMENAISMASYFASHLPKDEAPETTEKYEGFYYPTSIEGNTEKAKLSINLRDFTTEGIEKRLEFLRHLAKKTIKAFPRGSVEIEEKKQYANMKAFLNKKPKIMQLLFKSANECGLNPISKPIRGGTDGSRLSEMGLPTPNIFTGMHDFHSKKEWLCVDDMEKSFYLLLSIVNNFSSISAKAISCDSQNSRNSSRVSNEF